MRRQVIEQARADDDAKTPYFDRQVAHVVLVKWRGEAERRVRIALGDACGAAFDADDLAAVAANSSA